MLIQQVAQLSVLDQFIYFIRERESIRLKRLAGEPRPWTDDEILQRYRFTNVRRADDRVSEWLLDNWYLPNHGHRNMLLAVGLARFINLPDSLEEVGFPKRWDPERIKRILRARKERGDTVFNAAYMVRGNDGVDKVASVIDHTLSPLSAVRTKLLVPSSMERTWANLEARYGFGSFMAGQVVADLRWAYPGEWLDRDTWAPRGPGSMRGLNRLLSRPLKFQPRQTQFLVELRSVVELVKRELDPAITSRMEMIDFQSCLCETDKYLRVLLGEGRPKSTYPGV